MKQKRTPSFFGRGIIVVILLAIVGILMMQVYLFNNQLKNLDLQATIEAQQTQVAQLMQPTATLRAQDTSQPTVTQQPTRSLEPTATPETPYIMFSETYRDLSLMNVASDGLQIAGANSDYEIVIQQLGTDERRIIGTTIDTASLINWSRNRNRLAVVDRSYNLNMFNVESGEQLAVGRIPDYITEIRLSPDGSYLLGRYEDKLFLWDTQTLTQTDRHELDELFIMVNGMSWSPDGSRLALATGDGFRIIYVENGIFGKDTFLNHDYTTNRLRWSPDGSMLAGIDEDDQIRVYEMDTMEVLHLINGHLAEVTFADWSPDARYLVSTSRDRTAKIWDIASGELLYTLPHDEAVSFAVWHHNNNWLMTYTNQYNFWAIPGFIPDPD